MTGCVTPVVGPSILDAAVRVLCRHGIEVVVPEGQACCGGLVHHMGRSEEAYAAVRHNVAAWTSITPPVDAILVTASGCGTTLKDYGFMLRHDSVHGPAAALVSALAMDVCEYLARVEVLPHRASNGKIVAYHAALAPAWSANRTRAKDTAVAFGLRGERGAGGHCAAARPEPTTFFF
jgi:glycolate oxidase iron-sulfur subunit